MILDVLIYFVCCSRTPHINYRIHEDYQKTQSQIDICRRREAIDDSRMSIDESSISFLFDYEGILEYISQFHKDEHYMWVWNDFHNSISVFSRTDKNIMTIYILVVLSFFIEKYHDLSL